MRTICNDCFNSNHFAYRTNHRLETAKCSICAELKLCAWVYNSKENKTMTNQSGPGRTEEEWEEEWEAAVKSKLSGGEVEQKPHDGGDWQPTMGHPSTWNNQYNHYRIKPTRTPVVGDVWETITGRSALLLYKEDNLWMTMSYERDYNFAQFPVHPNNFIKYLGTIDLNLLLGENE